MKFIKVIIWFLGAVFICWSAPAFSQEFQWVHGFNEQANQDLEAFKGLLAERFRQRLRKVNTIFNEAKTPSDTYMAFKLSEMSNRPVSDVIDVYGKGKSKGWGALAKKLGIKPGSKEFHDLKRQDDLYHGKYYNSYDDGKKKGKGKKNKGSGTGNKKQKKSKD